MSTEIRVFQIFYNEETRASLDPDFEPLDNSDSERADWYEYWLKLAFAGTDDPNYLRLYAQLRERVLAGTWLADKPQAAKAAV